MRSSWPVVLTPPGFGHRVPATRTGATGPVGPIANRIYRGNVRAGDDFVRRAAAPVNSLNRELAVSPGGLRCSISSSRVARG